MCWSLGIVCRAVVHNFVKMNGYSVHGGDTMWMCQASAHNWLLFKVNWRCNYIAGAHSLRFFMKHERTGASTPSHSCTPAHDTGGTTSHFPLSGEVGILSSNFIMKIVQTAARLGLDSWEWMEFSFFSIILPRFFPAFYYIVHDVRRDRVAGRSLKPKMEYIGLFMARFACSARAHTKETRFFSVFRLVSFVLVSLVCGEAAI